MTFQVEMRLELPYEIAQAGKWYVASCPVLDVHSQGETPEKAKDNLVEALTAFLTSCIERGTLDAVFKQCGFKTHRPQGFAGPAQPRQPRPDYLDIPIPFLVNTGDPELCHA